MGEHTTAEKDAGHGIHCDGCLMVGLLVRLEKAEAELVELRAAVLPGYGKAADPRALRARVTPPDEGRT